MTEGTSQGLFIVVAIVIFGIFVTLSYVVFGDVLQPKMVEMFETALNIEVDKGTPETETPAPVDPEPTPETPVDPEARVQFEDENLEFVVTATLYGFDTNLRMAAMEKASEDLGPDFNGSEEQLLPYIKEIRDEIKSDNPVTFEKIKELTEIDTTNIEFNSLIGLEHAVNLKKLRIFGSNVTDLTPLAGLINLEHLLLADSHIKDLTPLANLTNLKWLTLAYLDITDISPLYNLKQLQFLDFYGNYNPITDYSGVEFVPELHKDSPIYEK